MSHENHKNKLLQYFYQELAEKERKEFEAHLSKCPLCKDDLENLKSMSLELNQAFDQAKVGDVVLGRILEKAEVTRKNGFLSRPLPRIKNLRWGLSYSAAALFLLGLALSLWMVFLRPDPKAYDYNQLAENIGSLEQDFSEEYGASEIAMLGSDDSSGNSLESMEQEIVEIQEISKGIFEL